MSCKSCQGSNFVEEGNQNICQDCGNIQDSMYLVTDSSSMMSTFMKYDNPIDTISYRNFKKLYECCARTLNTPRHIEEEGVLMLPSMWKAVINRRNKTKRLFLISMLYLLYRQHRMPVVFSQFLKHAHVPQEKLTRISQLVMKQFNLPMFEITNKKDITANSISELVKLVFKETSTKMERETEVLALRLSNIIYKKEWGETSSKNYISLVSIVSTLLSAQYVCSNETSRKTKGGRKCCFRFKTLDYQKLADHMCVHVMAVKKCLKCMQCKFFKVVQLLPWTAAVVKKSIDVARVIVDIIDYVDIDVKEEEEEDIPPIIPRTIKLVLLQALLEYVTDHKDLMKKDCPQIDISKFKLIFDHKWRETMNITQDYSVSVKPENSGENISVSTNSDNITSPIGSIKIENTEDDKNIVHNYVTKSGKNNCKLDVMPVYKKDQMEIKEYIIRYHYLELYKDLLLSGCSIKELTDEDYISLVEKYVDMPNAEDEHEMEEFTENELSLYFRDPAEFISLDEKCRKLSESGANEKQQENAQSSIGILPDIKPKRIKLDNSVGCKTSNTRLTADIHEIQSLLVRDESSSLNLEVKIKEEFDSSFSSIEDRVVYEETKIKEE